MFSRRVRVAELVTHRLPVARGLEAFALATSPRAGDAEGDAVGGDRVTRRMRAAVLHGREDVRVEAGRAAPARAGRGPAPHASGAHLRHRRQGVPPRLPRAHARAPRALRPRGRGSRRGGGPGVEGVRPGERVVVANSAPCGVCAPCLDGREGLCDDLLFWNGAYAEFALIPARIVEKNLCRSIRAVDFRRRPWRSRSPAPSAASSRADVAAGHTVGGDRRRPDRSDAAGARAPARGAGDRRGPQRAAGSRKARELGAARGDRRREPADVAKPRSGSGDAAAWGPTW